MFNAAHDPASVASYRPLAELIPRHWRAGELHTPSGATIHYTHTGGDKPTLLLLHGFQASGIMWLRTALALEAEYHIVMPDFRGHGASNGVEYGYSSGILVEDMVALIDALKVQRPVVVGHSMGAEVAGWLAIRQPEHVRALVLVDPPLMNFAPPPSPDGGLPDYMQPIIQTMNALKMQSHAERLVTALNLLFPGTPLWSEPDYVSFVQGMADFDHATYRCTTTMGESLLCQSPDEIARIQCPALLLTARVMMPGADTSAGAAAFENNLRDGRHIHFEDSGHFIPFDQFDRFLFTLQDFLGQAG